MKMRVIEALNQSFHTIMQQDSASYFLGEDILDPYGGAFKASKGLATKFPDRVLTTPISEAAIIGFGFGLAMRGYPAIVEIMFGDFLALGMDQLVNQVSKFEWVFDQSASLPLIVRTPMGGGRGYGPTHSQCLEKHFCGIPGLNVVAIHRYMDLIDFYVKLTKARRPTLVIENKALYAQPVHPSDVLKPGGQPDVILLAYGRMVDLCEQAAVRLREQDEITVETVPVHQLYPFDKSPLVQAAGRCRRMVAVEEAPDGWGFGAECASALINRSVKFSHVAASNHPVPASRRLEEEALPSVAKIIEAVQKMF